MLLRIPKTGLCNIAHFCAVAYAPHLQNLPNGNCSGHTRADRLRKLAVQKLMLKKPADTD